MLALAGCGEEGTTDAESLRSCVGGRADRVDVSTEEDVTTLVFVSGRSETAASVFPSAQAAESALDAEARIGDAHDKRVRNVLFSGGGATQAAVAECLG